MIVIRSVILIVIIIFIKIQFFNIIKIITKLQL